MKTHEHRSGMEFERRKPPSKLIFDPVDRPLSKIQGYVHEEIDRDNEDENVAVEAANKGTGKAESGFRKLDSMLHRHRMSKYSRTVKAEEEKTRLYQNLSDMQKKAEENKSTAEISKMYQRQAVREEYVKAKRDEKSAQTAGQTAEKVSEAAKQAVNTVSETARKARDKVTEFASEHPVAFGIILIAVLLFLLAYVMLASCSAMVTSAINGFGFTAFPAAEEDLIAAEEYYLLLEDDLRFDMLLWESYNEGLEHRQFYADGDEIFHDPYVLLSCISALTGGEKWTIDDAKPIMQNLFDRQYIVTHEAASVTLSDGELNLFFLDVENRNLSHVPADFFTEYQLSLYAMYMSTLGDNEDLFPDSEYVDIYIDDEYEPYDIPEEYLEDETFAALIEEANKYIGYPYVWGGSSPSTSFDCSGFVCYVYNNCGAGWNFGRTTAEGLRSMCHYVSPANAKPGDLIFFENTYETTGASHVGIYVGDNRMLHCGDPIQYTSITTAYWQEHFLQFGRLPNP